MTKKDRALYGFRLPDKDDERESRYNHVSDIDIKALGAGFIQGTTSHIIHIFRASTRGKMAFWLILTLGCTGTLGYHVSILLKNFLSFDVNTSLSEKSMPKLEFPAVTICNENMIRKSKIPTGINNEWEEATNVSYDKQAEAALYVYELAIQWLSSMKLKERQEYGHQAEDIIISCSLNGRVCMPEDFTVILDPDYGNCYTFKAPNNNSAFNDTVYTRRSGPRYGLKLLLNLQQYEYINSLTESSGMVITVHDKNKMPFPEEEGFSVGPNTLTDVAIKQKYYERLDGLYGDCIKEEASTSIPDVYRFEYPDVKYSKSSCLKTCLQQETVKKCKCYLPEIPYNSSVFNDLPAATITCDSLDENGECMESINIDYSNGVIECTQCKDPCMEIEYEISAFDSTWPSDAYMDEFVHSLKEYDEDTYLELEKHYGENLTQGVKENLVLVNIYFERMISSNMTQTIAYGLWQLVADFGGVFGLWLGFSFITFFEIFELVADLFVLACLKCTNKKGDTTMVTPIKMDLKQQPQVIDYDT